MASWVKPPSQNGWTSQQGWGWTAGVPGPELTRHKGVELIICSAVAMLQSDGHSMQMRCHHQDRCGTINGGMWPWLPACHHRVTPYQHGAMAQVLRVPPTWQHQIDLACLSIRSKAYSDQVPRVVSKGVGPPVWPAVAADQGACRWALRKLLLVGIRGYSAWSICVHRGSIDQQSRDPRNLVA